MRGKLTIILLLLSIMLLISAESSAYDITRYNTVRMDQQCLSCHPNMRDGYLPPYNSGDEYARIHMQYCGGKQLVHLSRFVTEYAFISMEDMMQRLEERDGVDVSEWRTKLNESESEFEVLLRRPMKTRMQFREPARLLREDLAPSYREVIEYQQRIERRTWFGIFTLFGLALVILLSVAYNRRRSDMTASNAGEAEK